MAGSDPAFLIRDHLDRYGVDYAILTGSHVLGLSVHPDPDWGNVIATAYNQNLADRWLSHSPRFRGSIVVNHSDPAAAARAIRRYAPDRRFVQVLMASGSPRLFGQRFFHPLYEAAAEYNLPVAIHPGTEGAGNAGAPTPAGRTTRYLEWHNIVPIDFMAHVNSLVCEGVLSSFPRLNSSASKAAWLGFRT
jgi:predicted TIM-barrel fold metal-dependent hydrolase